MAIVEMKKIYLVGHQHIENRVIQILQRLGVVQIINIKEKKEKTEIFSKGEGERLEERLSQLNRILHFLNRYEKIGFVQGLWESFFPAKAYFENEEARHILRTFSEVESFNKYKNLEEKKDIIKIEREKLKEERKILLHYYQFPLAKKDLASSERIQMIWGLIPKKTFLKASSALTKKFKNIWLETFKADRKSLFLVIVCLWNDLPNITQFLNNLNFQFGVFSKNQVGTFKERLKDLEEEESLLDLEEENLNKDIQNLLKDKPKLLLLHDTISNRLEQRYINRNFSQTRVTFILEGWIKASDVKILEDKLIKIFPELEVVISSVPPDSQPPIAFQNRNFIKPFEFITKLYGAPHYLEFDPTPFLMPFFALFFGICISDVGYGLVLLLLGLFVLNKLKLEPAQKMIFRVLVICGVIIIVLGLLLGSIFSLDFEHLPRLLGFLKGFREKLMIFDPLKNIMLFLGICLGLGVIQIYFGILLKVIIQIKRKKIIEALFQELPWIFLISGLLLWIIIYFGNLTDSLLPLAKILSLAGGTTIFLFAGRGTKNIFLRLGKGLFKLYGTVGILGDILSYSRLLALGLASTVIGLAVNITADLFFKIPFVGIIFGLLVVLIGHGFNLFISSLGGFAHTLRLQFVEFFTKFYEGGGEVFQPFKLESKFTKVG